MDLPRLAVPLLAAALLATACAGADRATLDAEAAEQLTRHTDELAAALESGDGCAALERARDLITASSDGVADGSVDAAIAREIVATTTAATSDVRCEPEPAATTDDDEEEKEEEQEKEAEKARKEAEKARKEAEEERKKEAEEERKKAEEERKEEGDDDD